MLEFGFQELVFILVVALLVLGPDRLPEIARVLGRFAAKIRRMRDQMRVVDHKNSSGWLTPTSSDQTPKEDKDETEENKTNH